jgi:hypothetical protein
VRCNECRALIEYLPEEVKTHRYTTMGASGCDTYVKCPRDGCPGRGVITSV